MPNMTLCSDVGCPSRETCKRSPAVTAPAQFGQAWANFAEERLGKDKCEMYLDREERDWHADMDLCRRATPGPWTREFDELTEEEIISPTGYHGYGKAAANCYADADFIVAARSALPYWLGKYRELYELVRQTRPG